MACGITFIRNAYHKRYHDTFTMTDDTIMDILEAYDMPHAADMTSAQLRQVLAKMLIVDTTVDRHDA